MEEYKPKIYLQIGGKDTGKSTFTRQFIMDLYNAQEVGCLVLDIAEQDIYQDFENVELEQIPYFRPNSQKPFYRCTTTDVERFLYLVYLYVRNCLIVLEDVTPHFSGSISRNKQNFILGSRNKGLDVLFNTHSVTYISNFLWLNADTVILRKTPENITKFPPNKRGGPIVEKAIKQIAAENARNVVYNKFGRRVYPAYRVIDLDTGNFL